MSVYRVQHTVNLSSIYTLSDTYASDRCLLRIPHTLHRTFCLESSTWHLMSAYTTWVCLKDYSLNSFDLTQTLNAFCYSTQTCNTICVLFVYLSCSNVCVHVCMRVMSVCSCACTCASLPANIVYLFISTNDSVDHYYII